jgi:hypothetical protein
MDLATHHQYVIVPGEYQHGGCSFPADGEKALSALPFQS